MAYFPNGTTGMDYEAKYCDNCVHFTDKDGEPYACAVLELHYEFNYEQGSKGKTAKAIKKVLDTLIPSDERGFATECSMFLSTRSYGSKSVDEQYEKHLLAGGKPLEFIPPN